LGGFFISCFIAETFQAASNDKFGTGCLSDQLVVELETIAAMVSATSRPLSYLSTRSPVQQV